MWCWSNCFKSLPKKMFNKPVCGRWSSWPLSLPPRPHPCSPWVQLQAHKTPWVITDHIASSSSPRNLESYFEVNTWRLWGEEEVGEPFVPLSLAGPTGVRLLLLLPHNRASFQQLLTSLSRLKPCFKFWKFWALEAAVSGTLIHKCGWYPVPHLQQSNLFFPQRKL